MTPQETYKGVKPLTKFRCVSGSGRVQYKGSTSLYNGVVRGTNRVPADPSDRLHSQHVSLLLLLYPFRGEFTLSVPVDHILS